MDSLLAATPQKQRQGHPCAVYGIPSKTGTMVPMLGWVGPTYAQKFAALERTFERDGLTEFLDGPVTFEPVESEDAHGISQYDFPQHILEMRARAEKLGFNFEWK